jgi:hypothetical protein
MEISAVTCPKCNRVFSGTKYAKSSLKKHLARKNPCDRDPKEKYIRETTPSTQLKMTKDVQRYIKWLNWVRSHTNGPPPD